MFVHLEKLIWSQSLLDSILAALSVVPGGALLTAPKVHLYTDAHIPDPVNDTPASFTEAAFTGYAAVVLTTVGPENLSGNSGRMLQGDVDIICTGSGGGFPQILGCYLTNTLGATLYAQCPFDAPVNIARVGDAINLDFSLPLTFKQGF